MKLGLWQRSCTNIDAEHVPEPEVLADALVHHVFVDASAARVIRAGPDRKVVVSELAPHAEDLQTFGRIAVDQKVVSHGFRDKTTPLGRTRWN